MLMKWKNKKRWNNSSLFNSTIVCDVRAHQGKRATFISQLLYMFQFKKWTYFTSISFGDVKIKINFRNDFAPLPLNLPFVAMPLIGFRSHRSDQLVKIIALGWKIKDNAVMASIQHRTSGLRLFGFSLQNAGNYF